MDIASTAFKHRKAIPLRYSCEGNDVNPPLDINGIPENTISLALMIEDADAPHGSWLHWLVWNIPVTNHIRENTVPGDQGLNDFMKISYGGPCPPSAVHRYYFKVFALDHRIDLPEGSTKGEVVEAMQDFIIGYGELIGTYQSRTSSG